MMEGYGKHGHWNQTTESSSSTLLSGMISEQELAPPPHSKLRSSHVLKWDYAICTMYHHCEALPLSLLKGKADNEAQTNYVRLQ